MPFLPRLALASTLLLAGGGPLAHADDPCQGFKWDVRREHELFIGAAAALTAGATPASAPALSLDRLYALRLSPQHSVSFATEPGRTPADDGYAGVAVLKVAPGEYRVALDLPAWIDVAAGGKLATVVDFQGQRICDAPHKIVEFDLSGSEPFVLQVSGATDPTIRITVTKMPPRHLSP